MEQIHFVIHKRKSIVRRWILAVLVAVAIVTLMALNWLDHTDESAHGDLIFIGIFILFSFFALISIALMVNALIWNYTIQDEHIHYRSLFRREVFTFQDIEKVAVYYTRATHYSPEMNYWLIFLFGEKRPLSVHPKDIGSHFLLECLQNKNIQGAASLRTE